VWDPKITSPRSWLVELVVTTLDVVLELRVELEPTTSRLILWG
jgi:hypothetical protein